MKEHILEPNWRQARNRIATLWNASRWAISREHTGPPVPPTLRAAQGPALGTRENDGGAKQGLGAARSSNKPES